ncbi:MAG: M73 family metallopeptidase [Actinobacteria bacterium]|nr:M73 family metallopeptidase [Actinomycetota bacterium]
MSTQAARKWESVSRILAPIAAFLVVGLLVAGTSRAAFFDTTENGSNEFAAGDVVLTDDDSGAAMFDVTNMAPGDSATHCIEVTYEGSLAPADVEMYVASGDLTGTGLDDYLDLTVEMGTGGAFGDCSGFSGSTVFDGELGAFASAHTDFAGGTGSWTAAATDESRTYRFTFTLQDDNAAQALSAGVTFTWEAQNQ